MQERTRALLIGLILGDGHLTKSSGVKNTSALDLKYDEKYLEYLQWIHQALQELDPSPIRRKKGFHQYRFYTKRRNDIGILRQKFYPDGTKRIPKDIEQYLKDPLTIAIWYQDDGTLDFRRGYHTNALFATHCFSKDECILLANTLRTNFDLDVRVIRCLMRGKLYFRLYVTSKSMDKFMQLVEPYIQRCFHYKLVKVRLSSQQPR